MTFLGEEITTMDRWLQYGALGLCALMIMITQINWVRMAKAMDKKDERSSAIGDNAVRFIQRACDLLDARPCLHGHVKKREGLDNERRRET